MIWLGSLFLVVLSRNRAGGGGGASVWAPTMDHHLCSCSGNPTARNNHSYTLEGEAAAPIALSLQNLNSSQSLHMYFFKVSSRPAISGIYDCRWWVIWLIYLPLTFDLLPHAPSSTSTSSSASSVASSRGPTGGRCMRPKPRRLRWRSSPLRQRGWLRTTEGAHGSPNSTHQWGFWVITTLQMDFSLATVLGVW